MHEKVLDSIIDPEKQVKAKELAKINRIINIITLAFSFIYFFFAISSGWSVNIRNFLQTITNVWFLQISFYCFIFFGIISVITFPLSFYAEYFLQKGDIEKTMTMAGFASMLTTLGGGNGRQVVDHEVGGVHRASMPRRGARRLRTVL